MVQTVDVLAYEVRGAIACRFAQGNFKKLGSDACAHTTTHSAKAPCRSKVLVTAWRASRWK